MSDFDDVGEFHEKFDLPRMDYTASSRPISDSVRDFRLKFMIEELQEVAAGYGIELSVTMEPLPGSSYNRAQVADGLVDLVYVTLGTAHLHNFPWDSLWAEVHRANMTKERCGLHHFFVSSTHSDDLCHYKMDGKYCHRPRRQHSLRGNSNDVIKPLEWTAPDIEGILRRYDR